MYLAPLNADIFFKKVFSDLFIAKPFLEDVLDLMIEKIELLPLKHEVTVASVAIEFDFRWLSSRCSTPLALHFKWRGFLPKFLSIPKAKRKRNLLTQAPSQSSRSLVWVVGSTMNVDSDFLSFSMLPDELLTWLRNEELWEVANLERLLAERKSLLGSLRTITANRWIF